MTILQQRTSKGNGKIASIAPKKKKTLEEKTMKSVVSSVELVTPAMAQRFLDLGDYDLQRTTTEAHVEELVEEINAGRFEQGTPIWLAEQTGTNQFVMVNGRHTCKAIVHTKIAQELTVIRSRISTMEEAGRIYSRLDINKPRRPYDRIKALKIPAVSDLNVAETNGLIAAIKMLLGNFENAPGAKPSNKDRSIYKSAEKWAVAIEEWRVPIQKYFSALEYCEKGQQRRRFLRSSTMAVALATLRGQPIKAWEFWATAAADDGLRARAPARKLNSWLLINKGGPSSVAVRQAKYIAACWNAYFDGREMQNVVPSDLGHAGVTIKGTSFKAKGTSFKAKKK